MRISDFNSLHDLFVDVLLGKLFDVSEGPLRVQTCYDNSVVSYLYPSEVLLCGFDNCNNRAMFVPPLVMDGVIGTPLASAINTVSALNSVETYDKRSSDNPSTLYRVKTTEEGYAWLKDKQVPTYLVQGGNVNGFEP
jgi:hypothetical protein